MYKRLVNITGWLTFAIAMIVYFLSAERTGSLWDCGEFISGAYKLEVVHPPGAALFLIVGRMFTLIAEVLSNNPEDIAFAVNLASGVASAFAAMFVCWVTIILGKLTLFGKDSEPEDGGAYAILGGGLIAGLSTAFATSVWFSAVEGEVYALSTFFTTLTLWAAVKWYNLPDAPKHDRWLMFAVYSAGLSIGVHLLSLLTFPALALFYYFKKRETHTLRGMAIAVIIGVALISFIQIFIIAGIPKLWSQLELLMVNGLGMPIHTGLIPLFLILTAIFYFGISYARKKGNHLVELLTVGALLVVIGNSTIGIVLVRSNANPPINMNEPSDAMRLIPYLNREQYGERPLLRGPHYDARPSGTETTPRYGIVGDRYEIVDEKVEYTYKNSDKMLFCRMGDSSQGRPDLYRAWTGNKGGSPTMAENIKFLFRYQLGWMYWRYFMWNFAGRQNGDQGLYKWDPKNGHWLSGIGFLDEARLYDMDQEPAARAEDMARNKYYMLPFLFGLLGLIFHFRRRSNEAIALVAMFIMTGIGIIIYSNQPPNEPRERDYVLVGSFFTYCIWIGIGAMALYRIIEKQVKLNGNVAAAAAVFVVLSAPVLMGTQNFDDHSRRLHTASRDYASNFLNSCAENAIIFTYGDNDTYPLWYAQEVEGIRTDVRVVNLSLIAVDWYIDQLRRKVNDSPAIKMTIPREALRGKKRNSVPYYNPSGNDREMSLQAWLKYVGEDHPLRGSSNRIIDSHFPSRNVYLPIDRNQVLERGILAETDTANIVSAIPFNFTRDYYLKDDLAVLDIIASNLMERPIYFAVTCRPDNMLGLQDYMQLEGLALRIVPVRTESDRKFGVIGNGRVATDVAYENIKEKFAWGNFDKYKLFVNHSYGPSIQSHRISILRTAEALAAEGDTERANELIDEYFVAFPEMNFPYDYNTMLMLNVYSQTRAYDKLKPHLVKLADATVETLQFLYSLDPEQLDQGLEFGRDLGYADRTKDEILRIASMMGDDAFLAEMNKKFEPFAFTQQPK